MLARMAGLCVAIAWAAETAHSAESQAESVKTSIEPPQAVGEQAAIAFQMRPDKWYGNGEGQPKIAVKLLSIPGLAECSFQQASDMCRLIWAWDASIKTEGLDVPIPELPGPESYSVIYTWDAKAGRFNGYVNGIPLRLPDTEASPWTMEPADKILAFESPFAVSDVLCEPRYVTEKEAAQRVADSVRGRHADLFGVHAERDPMDVQGRLGLPIYQAALGSPESVNDWVMEGPGIVRSIDGWMEMASERPQGPDGHFVYWCPRDFPDGFVAEWEAMPVSNYGLCIVFFAAKGERGEDIFDENLPKRTGIFNQYTKGAILSYHMSYYANTPDSPGRITTNMRKNNKFYLVSNGPPGILPGSTEPHKIRLIKDKAHAQLLVDGRVIIDFQDDGKRYGPPLQDGKIGFRQMQWMAARYRDLQVWELKE